MGVYGEEHAGKITGMLLDEQVVDFKKILTDPVYLRTKMDEAFKLIGD